ncbi:beta-glucosidase BglX [Pseudomonas citronellolis]|uniref:beta-glucosidase BglX n=1 Tax=Pseudomonas citronellolis TaxID=53408 RepID=UPI00264816F4|nr:beta-glucosidase BglX [Pseudomonas citronellolis]MDN6876782.1 beta-glucosidase BglX [Pseudomonas citronellolis]
MKRTHLCLGLLLGLNSVSLFAAEGPAVPLPGQSKDAFISQLMQQMTQDEKIGQLRLVSVGPEHPKPVLLEEIKTGNTGAIFNTVVRPGIRDLQDAAMRSRLKIPLFFAYDVVHGHRTVFPIGLGLAASWDMDAVATSARIAALEASADGLNLTYSPTVDIARDPRWGRVSEGFGEDTYLVSRIAGTVVKAYQGKGLDQPGTIMAGVKHFALYGAGEGGRDYNTVDMSLPRMFQDYLPPYRAAIDAGAGAVMVSLNSVNGVPATANKWLLQDVLRKQWGYKGVLLSDHGAVMELIKHGVAGEPREAARLAMTAGVEMNMNDDLYGKELPELLKTGAISQADIDRACRDVLAAKWDMGLFKDPYRYLQGADPLDTDAESRLHRAEARDVARRGMVLLKNEGDVLPLKRGGIIALVGPLADSKRDVMGSWSAAGKAFQAVTLLEGMGHATRGKAALLYAKGANVTNDEEIIKYLNEYNEDVKIDPRSPQAMIDEAVAKARQADVIVAAIGEAQGMAHEASSKTNLHIAQSQYDLLKALKATGKPLVLVLMNGRPLDLRWETENADAVLETWFSGTEGGNAIADVLFGDYNPSGKLPMTFPRSVGQIPIYYNHLNTGRPFDHEHPNKYTSRYFDSQNGPLYPFGYGLSYTRFSVSDVQLSSPKLHKGDTLKARVTVKNTGKRAGETVVQLYLRDEVASISRPVKELKGFRKVMLQPGESKVVEFPIREEDLRFYDSNLRYASEPGEFKVMIGLDSDDVKESQFTLL